MKSLDIIIPVKNEAKNIIPLVQRIHTTISRMKIPYNMIFIDDHSTDSTVRILRGLASQYPLQIHTKKGKSGKAFSILEGASYSQAEYIAMIDADLQYPPEVIPQMLDLAQTHGMVVANRKTYNGTTLRRLGSRAIAFMFGKLLFGFNVDIQSGLKLFRRELIEYVETKHITPWALDIPLLYTAHILGYQIGSVDITFTRRENGESKVNAFANAIEIALTALKVKILGKRIFTIKPQQGSMIGAGVIRNKQHFVTHTTMAHEMSALETLVPWQTGLTVLIILAIVVGLIAAPLSTAIFIVGILSTIYFIDVIFNFLLILKSLHQPPEVSIPEKELNVIDDSSLPVYTVLCPLYRELHVLPQFLKSIDKIDWPKSKLDVILLFEEDDIETIDGLKSIKLPKHVRAIIVPDSQPKTKPKACNYGLAFAKGEYIVIFDAEDVPDPMQLKKAYLAFARVPSNVACLQAKLNFYNPHHNLLTRMFTAEYSLWFDVVLTGLQSIETSLPLGGTSNHFRTKTLTELHGWDPFNVTEDCDLGVRLFQEGYKTAIIDSTTLEEANSNVRNWIRQRSRWIKGYIQTYFVTMRHPFRFFQRYGIHALIFQLVVGGKIAFMFINPFLWVATLSYFLLFKYVGPTIEAIYPAKIFYMAIVSLVFGNFMCMYYYMIGCAQRNHWPVVKYVFFIPVYWLLVSYAAMIALFQFIVNPHYWEKTIHGLHLGDGQVEENPGVVQAQVGYVDVLKEKYRGLTASHFKMPRKLANFKPTYIGGTLLIGASVFANFFNFLYNAYLGRSISVEDFGLISLFASFLYLSQVVSGATSTTMTHRSAYLFGKYGVQMTSYWRRIRGNVFLVSVCASVIWALCIPLLARFFNSDSIVPFILFTPVWIINLLGAVDGGFLNGNMKFNFLALIITIESLNKFISSVVLVNLGYSSFVYATIPFSMSVSLLITWIVISRMPSKEVRLEAKDVANFPKKFFASSILMRLSIAAFLTMDVILAKHFLTPDDAGRYAMLSLVGKMIYFLGTLFSQFITPVISHVEGAGKNSQYAFLRLLIATSTVCFVGFLLLGVFGHVTVPLLLGERANGIIGLLPVYAWAMTCFTIASCLIAYHQIRKEYIFPITGFFLAAMQIGGIYTFHEDLQSITMVMFLLGISYLVVVSLLHVFLSPIQSVISNIQDLFGIFAKLPRVHTKGNEKHRILIFNWRDTKHVWSGGAEVYVHEMAKQWVKSGHEVTVFCGNDRKHQGNETVDGVHVIRRGGFYTVYIWAFFYYQFRLRGKFDWVIDSQNGVPFFTPLFVGVRKLLLIHHVHQDVFREHLKFPFSHLAMFIESVLMPFVYRNEQIVTVSNSSKQEIIRLIPGSEHRIHVISPGVDVDNMAPARKTTEPSFLYLGRLKPYKNIDTLIKAFAHVLESHPEALLTIAGEGESMGALKRLTKELSIENSVDFIGKVSETEKIALLAQSWVVVHPSSVEGWGITVMEANACGTPVIASNVNGLMDSVRVGKTGVLVPVKDVAAFSSAMIRLLEDSNYRQKLSKCAYDWSQSFSWKACADQFLQVLNDPTGRLQDIHADQFALARN